MYGGVLSLLFVKFSRRSKKIKFVKFHVFGKKIRKLWEIEKLREKKVEIMKKNISDKNDPSCIVSTRSKPYSLLYAPVSRSPGNLVLRI